MSENTTRIYLTAVDKVSPVLAIIGDKTKALDKETQMLAQSYAAFNRANEPLLARQQELKQKLEVVARTLADSRAAWKKYDSAIAEQSMKDAIAEQDALRRELSLTNQALRENETIFKQNMATIRKEATGTSAVSDETALAGLVKGLAVGQVGQMVASSLGGIGETLLTSAIGVPEASAISNTLSGAISGAASGAIAGIPGAIIGGIAGALSGGISAAGEIYEAKDDAFKEYYAGLYEDANAASEEMISSGSATAGSREQTKMAFARRLGGDEEAAGYLSQVESFAAHTNYDYDEITEYAKLLLNTYDKDEVFSVLQSLSDATAGLSLSGSDVETMIKGLSRMRTTGKTTQEYLDYFSERGVDVYAALADALVESGVNVNKSDIAGMVSAGDIEGGFAAGAILDYINETYGGLSEDLMGTYNAVTDNLNDIMTSIEAAGGEGYNALRTEGRTADTEAYSGALGEALKDVNRVIGENQAYLENLSDQYRREALSAVLLGEETSEGLFSEEDESKLAEMSKAFAEAAADYATGNQKAGLTMERVKEEAEALATAAYESSQQYQDYQDSQMEQIEAIRENTAGLAAATNAYLLNQELSRGLASTDYLVPDNAFSEYEGMQLITDEEYEQALLNRDQATIAAYGQQSAAREAARESGYAYGLNRVPYDDFPALLHEGERVLTASEARAADRQGASNVTVNIFGEFNVRDDRDIPAIAEAVAEQFRMEKLAGVYAVY